jgi:hypothetical protein
MQKYYDVALHTEFALILEHNIKEINLYVPKRSEINLFKSFDLMSYNRRHGSFITIAWLVLRLWMEDMASRYGG